MSETLEQLDQRICRKACDIWMAKGAPPKRLRVSREQEALLRASPRAQYDYHGCLMYHMMEVVVDYTVMDFDFPEPPPMPPVTNGWRR